VHLFDDYYLIHLRHQLDHTMLTSNPNVIRTVDRNVAKEARNNQFYICTSRTL
jgi:hypothetical protein